MMKLRIVADDKIPFLRGALEPFAEVTYLPGGAIAPADVKNADALITRTRTRCGEALLAGSRVRFIATATIGYDHIDTAYLRRAGADTSDVQRMFQGDLKSMIARYDIIRQAQLYHGDLAVAALDTTCDRVTAAKAADELLTLKGIRASFVLYPKDQGVYISARSLGEVNVQVIVEALGGGGNSTTAGGQLNVPDIAVARTALLRAIDEYFEK